MVVLMIGLFLTPNPKYDERAIESYKPRIILLSHKRLVSGYITSPIVRVRGSPNQ